MTSPFQMPRLITLLLIGSSAMTLAACGPNVHFGPAVDIESHGKMKQISKLTCPQEQGRLKLVSATPDGQSCQYEGEDTEVTLRLLALNGGSPNSALTPIETELKALMPEAATAGAGKDSVDKLAENDRGERQSVDLPGVHIRADDRGAKVRVAGINIDADDDRAEIRVARNTTDDSDDAGSGGDKSVSIKTDNDEFSINSQRDRDRADRHHRHRSRDDNVQALYMLASDKSANGYRVVGYDAAGPKGGPLAVAIVKSKADKDDEHNAFSDAKALVRLNVGGRPSHIRID